MLVFELLLDGMFPCLRVQIVGLSELIFRVRFIGFMLSDRKSLCGLYRVEFSRKRFSLMASASVF